MNFWMIDYVAFMAISMKIAGPVTFRRGWFYDVFKAGSGSFMLLNTQH